MQSWNPWQRDTSSNKGLGKLEISIREYKISVWGLS